MLEFLETRASELLPSQGDKLSQLLKGDTNRRIQRKVFQINDEKPEKQKRVCSVCKGDHPIWRCDKLRKECAKVRTDMIRSLKLCFKCLLKHEIGVCDKDDCPYCGGPHNSLLCYKKENDEKAKKEKGAIKWKPKETWKDDSDWDDEPKKSKNDKQGK